MVYKKINVYCYMHRNSNSYTGSCTGCLGYDVYGERNILTLSWSFFFIQQLVHSNKIIGKKLTNDYNGEIRFNGPF